MADQTVPAVGTAGPARRHDDGVPEAQRISTSRREVD